MWADLPCRKPQRRQSQMWVRSSLALMRLLHFCCCGIQATLSLTGATVQFGCILNQRGYYYYYYYFYFYYYFPSLISNLASVDVKQNVYLLTYFIIIIITLILQNLDAGSFYGHLFYPFSVKFGSLLNPRGYYQTKS